MKKLFTEFLKDIGMFFFLGLFSLLLGILSNEDRGFSYLSCQKHIIKNALFICSYLYILTKSIRGKYVFSTPKKQKKNLGILLTVASIIFFIWLNNVGFTSNHGRYSQEVKISYLFEDYTGLDDSYWLILSPILLYSTFILIGLAISIKNEKTKFNNVTTQNENLKLLIELKESGKLSAEDFYEEVKKLKV